MPIGDLSNEDSVLTKWDFLGPDIHRAVFSLPRDRTVAGRVGSESERMFNEVTALQKSEKTASTRFNTVLTGLSTVQKAFYVATSGGNFSENRFVKNLTEELAYELASQEIVHPNDTEYLSELRRACDDLILIVCPDPIIWKEALSVAKIKVQKDVS